MIAIPVDRRVNLHPLNALTHEADLIYYHGPFLTLLRNAGGDPYLFLWCDSDAELNRWIAVRVTEVDLSAYAVAKTRPLLDMIRHAADGLLFLVDVDADFVKRATWHLPVHELPNQYLPAADSYYEFEPTNVELDIGAIAERLNSDVLNLHLLRGRGVEYGTASISTLGAVLQASGNCTEALAEDLFYTPKTEMTRREARAYGSFMWETKKAASFSAVLRPLVTQKGLFEDSTAEVIRHFFELISSAERYDTLLSTAKSYSGNVMRRLLELFTALKAAEIALDFQWIETETGTRRKVSVDPDYSRRALANLQQLEIRDLPTLSLLGHFRALDQDTRKYTFVSEDGTVSKGVVDGGVIYPLDTVQWTTRYSVEIVRRLVESKGKHKAKVSDTMRRITATAFFELPPPEPPKPAWTEERHEQ